MYALQQEYASPARRQGIERELQFIQLRDTGNYPFRRHMFDVGILMRLQARMVAAHFSRAHMIQCQILRSLEQQTAVPLSQGFPTQTQVSVLGDVLRRTGAADNPLNKPHYPAALAYKDMGQTVHGSMTSGMLIVENDTHLLKMWLVS